MKLMIKRNGYINFVDINKRLIYLFANSSILAEELPRLVNITCFTSTAVSTTTC